MRRVLWICAAGIVATAAAKEYLDLAACVGAGQDTRSAASPATSKPEEGPAFVRGKYRCLLRKLYVPQDIKTDGEVHDYGWWTGKAWGGYSDLPPGYWVYSAPHWYIFAEKIGEVSPLAGWSLFKNVDANCGLPDALVKAYAQYAKFAKAGDAGGFRSACLPQGVTISNDARPKEREEYGEGINIPFVKKAFQQDVQSVRKDSESCWLVRTNSTAIWFVETARDGWKVYRVLDKPIE